MGKKSKAKKERRKNEKQKELEKEVKISKKEKKEHKEHKEKKEKKERRIKITKKQILGGILTLIMLTVLITVGYLLFQKAFKPRPIAKLLPAQETVAIVEINSNFDHNQLEKAFAQLDKHENYSKKALIEYIEDKFMLDYEEELKPWLGRVVGLAVIKSGEEGKYSIVYFAEVFSETNAKKFMEKSSDGLNKELLNEYMIMSTDKEVLKELQKPSESRLYDSESYRRIDDNMPLNKAAYFFVNFEKIDDDFLQTFPLLDEIDLPAETVKPFLSLLDSEGMALVAMDDKFALQTFISLNREALEDSKYISFKEKYTANLSEYVASDAIAFWGGENLEYQIKRMLEAVAGADNSIIEVFDKVIQNYSQKYFGPEIIFETDILPLFANEFALAMEKDENGEDAYKLIIELTDPSSQAVKIHEIADNFAEIGAIFEPKVVEHTMEDGTVSKEIVAVAEAITKQESKYKDATIYELQMGKGGWTLAYSIVDNVAIIATSPQAVKNAIDAKNKEIVSLKDSEIFNNLISPVLSHSDEVTYFNMEELLPIMFGDEEPPFLELISSLSSGKSYFDDGITSINYLRIK